MNEETSTVTFCGSCGQRFYSAQQTELHNCPGTGQICATCGAELQYSDSAANFCPNGCQ